MSDSAYRLPPPHVAFLGPLGTYTHQAAEDFFGNSPTFAACQTITDVFKAVEGAECSYGVVPIENSTAGAVRETTEALRSTVLAVRGMTKLRISHALLASRGMDVANVKRIYSHEQGLAQCARYLSSRFPSAELFKCDSTSRAATLAREDLEAVAVCSLKCASLYDLEIIDEAIQDTGEANCTRFLVLSRSTMPLAPEFPVDGPAAASRPQSGVSANGSVLMSSTPLVS